MKRNVQCVKYKKMSEGLSKAPIPGDLGERIYNNVSQEAWKDWLNQQTILINEYKLSLLNPEHRKYLLDQMESYFFKDGVEMPDAWKE